MLIISLWFLKSFPFSAVKLCSHVHFNWSAVQLKQKLEGRWRCPKSVDTSYLSMSLVSRGLMTMSWWYLCKHQHQILPVYAVVKILKTKSNKSWGMAAFQTSRTGPKKQAFNLLHHCRSSVLHRWPGWGNIPVPLRATDCENY